MAISSTTERIHDRAAELREEGIEVSAHVADLIDPSEATRLVEEATSWHNSLDVLVNNAGMSQVGTDDLGRKFEELSHAEWRAGIDQNLDLAFNVTRAALTAITDSGHGRIIFVTSVTGPMVSAPGNPAYSAAKAGLDGLMRSLAIELGPTGTTVNSVNPGWIETGSALPGEVKAGAHTPVGRPAPPTKSPPPRSCSPPPKPPTSPARPWSSTAATSSRRSRAPSSVRAKASPETTGGEYDRPSACLGMVRKRMVENRREW